MLAEDFPLRACGSLLQPREVSGWLSGARGLTGRGGAQVCQLANDRPPAWDALAHAQMPAVWRQAATDWRRADGGVGGLMQLMGANQRRELQDIAVPSLSLPSQP